MPATRTWSEGGTSVLCIATGSLAWSGLKFLAVDISTTCGTSTKAHNRAAERWLATPVGRPHKEAAYTDCSHVFGTAASR